MQKPFYERVRDEVILLSSDYMKNLVDFDYLIIYGVTEPSKYFVIRNEKDNYLHLTGIYTNLSPKIFFEKCLAKELELEDIIIPSLREHEKRYKGTLRRKINVLPYFVKGIDNTYSVQENFSKNRVICNIASSNHNLTIGYVDTGNNMRPKSLLSGDVLELDKKNKIFYVLKRSRKSQCFDQLVSGETPTLTDFLMKNEEICSLIKLHE